MEGSDPNSNIWKETITINEKESGDEGIPLWLVLLNLGMILLVIIAGSSFLVLIYRKKNLSEKNEE
jgi:hypothetical protein